MKYTADFETATWIENETFVWAWAVCEIENSENIVLGNNIESFIDFCINSKNSSFYFHNLKFDSEFIISYLLSNGFEHIEKIKDVHDKSFTTLISDMGQFYSVEIYFQKRGKKVKKVSLYDSLKIIPFSVDDTARYFNLPISKLDLDYNTPRKRNHVLTDHEKDYIKNDVRIMALALKVIFDEKLTKMTRAGNALSDFKKTLGGEQKFYHYFPKLEYKLDEVLRRSYKGGFTYLNPKYKNKEVSNINVLDVNSLYPSVMMSCRGEMLPYRKPCILCWKI